MRWRCQATCVEQTQIDRDRITSASQQRKEAPPPPHGVPFGRKDSYPAEVETLRYLAEMEVVDSRYTTATRLGMPPTLQAFVSGGGSNSPGVYDYYAAGETMRYCAGMVIENKRPARWIAAAKAKLIAMANFCVARQTGVTTQLTITLDNSFFYGGFGQVDVGSTSTYETEATGSVGVGLLLAYQVTGNFTYLNSARLAANFLRTMQCGGYLTTGPSSSDAAGTIPVYYGTWTHLTSVSGFGGSMDHRYYADSLICLEFLKNLLTIDGDATYGSTTTLGGLMTRAPAQLLSQSIADARAFWAVGAYDVTVGAMITGLSATTPKEFFNSYPAAKFFNTGTGSWAYSDGTASTGTLITARIVADALRSLFAYEGFSTQVASVWNWLMTFTSNPLWENDPTWPSYSPLLNTDYAYGSNGHYNPKLCLAIDLQVRTTTTLLPCAMNGGRRYEWHCVGALAPIQSAQDPVSFKAAKDTVVNYVFKDPIPLNFDPSAETRSLLLFVRSGLSLQTDSFTLYRTRSVAALGNAFRYQPQVWNGTGGPNGNISY